MKAKVVAVDGNPAFLLPECENLIVICDEKRGWRFGLWDVYSAKMPRIGGMSGSFGEIEIPGPLALSAYWTAIRDVDDYAARLAAAATIQNWYGFFQNDLVFI